MASTVGFLLDTNILLHLLRGNDLGQQIDSRFALSASLNHSMISVVTAGEILSLAMQFNWGKKKIERLQDALDELVWIDVNRPEILTAYAEIDSFSASTGRKMGKNDVWIAATAKATNATLLTTDPDFDHLEGAHLTRIWIDPDSYKSP